MTGRGELERRVLEALGWPCPACARAVAIVLENPHDRHAFDRAAAALGVNSRRSLEGRMRKHGFPTLRQLQDWLRVLALLHGWEAFGHRLQQQAFNASSEPAVLWRAVHRVTGLPWSGAQKVGFATWLWRCHTEIGTAVTCGWVGNAHR